jgi:hypothetical protein
MYVAKKIIFVVTIFKFTRLVILEIVSGFRGLSILTADNSTTHCMALLTDYGRPVRKSPWLQGRKSNPNPKFLGTAEAYFVCHIGPKFQISLIYAFIGCP